MKSKELIIEEEFCDTMLEKLLPNELVFVKDAMSVYAMQESIAFAEWVNKNWTAYDHNPKLFHENLRISKPHTIEQLYSLFKKENP